MMSLLPERALNPSPLDEDTGSTERMFQSATEAFDTIVGKPRGIKPQETLVADASGAVSWRDQLAALEAPAAAKKGIAKPQAAAPAATQAKGWQAQLAELEGTNTPEETGERSDFGRGFEVSGKQLKQTAYGAAALIGDTLGSDKLKDWGLKGYKEAEKEVQAISKPTDSFTEAFENGGLGKWLSYSSGYLLGQVAETGAAAIAGGLVGGAMTGPAAPVGAATGAVVGAIEKGAAQAGIRKLVGNMIDKEATRLVANGVAKEAAAAQAAKSVYRTIGANTAATFLNATQELGSIYGEAVQEAMDKGEDYSLGRVWLAGVAATAVDSWADSKMLGGFVKSLGGDKAIKGVAMEALKGGFREGMTEGVQTAIERWGADKDLTSKEAFREYIDSAAVGILGGGISGGASGAINKFTAPADDKGGTGDKGIQGNEITTPESSKITRPDTENIPPATRDEVVSALRSGPALSYLYNTGTDEEKKVIEAALQRFGDTTMLDQVRDSKDAFDAGAAMLDDDDATITRLRDGINRFATNQPKGGMFKVPPRQPMTDEERLKQMDEADAALNQGTLANPPAPADSMEDAVAGAEAGFTRPAMTDEQALPENLRGTKLTDQNRQPLTDYFADEFAAANARRDTKTKQKTIDTLKAQMQRIGFSQPEIDQLANSGMTQQGDIDFGDADNLYSKDEEGRAKAVFFKDLRKVFFAKSAWRGQVGSRAFRALELHELGAHYSLEKMVGEQRYQELLGQMRALRGKDKTVDAAYASVPQDTAEQLTDVEALGYLIENHADQNVVQRLIQLIKDWYAKTFKGKELTTSDLYAMTVSAYNRHQKEVKRVYLNGEISTAPKAGSSKVDFQTALGTNPEAHQFLDFMTQFGNKTALSGSLAISPQMDIYRPQSNQVHDLDFAVADKQTLEQVVAALAERYPNSAIANQFSSWRTDSDVVSFTLDATKPNSLTVDLFTGRGGKDTNLDDVVSHTYAGLDGQQKKITLLPAKRIFEKKLAMNRLKDVDDAIATGDFDTLFSKAKPTVSDLPSALSKVMKTIVDSGVTDYNQVVDQTLSRLRSSPTWAPLEKFATKGLLDQAFTTASGKPTPAAEQFSDTAFTPMAGGKRGEVRPSYRQGSRVYRNASGEMVTVTDQRPISARLFMDSPSSKADGPEVDMGTYKQVEKKKPATLTPSETTPVMREYLSTLRGDSQKEAKQALADMTPDQRKAWESRYLKNKADAEARQAKKDAEKAESTRQGSLPLPEPEKKKRLGELERRVASIMNLSDESAVWRETRERIVAAIAEIDEKLRNSRFIEAGGKTFEAIDEADENAYLWGDQGFRTAKNLPTDKLLALRRSLQEDLQAIREQSSRGLATLFMRSVRHLLYDLSMLRSQAIYEGMSMADVDSVIAPSQKFLREMLSEIGTRKDVERIYDTDQAREARARRDDSSMTDEQFMARYQAPKSKAAEQIERFRGGLMNAVQEDLDAGRAATYRLIGDLKSKKIKDADAMRYAQKAMRDGEFTYGELLEAFRASGYDIPRSVLDLSGQVAAQTRMVDFVKANGDKHVYREEWLRSMDAVLKADINLKDNFTPAEQTAYELWAERRRDLAQRRQPDDVMRGAQDVETAFPNLLFVRYSLSQMRNPASISERELAALRATVGDLENAWFQDVAFALQTRPDMRDRIVGEEGAIAPTEVEQFRQWIKRKENAILKDAEVNSKAPYYQQLLGLDALPQEMFEKFRKDIAVAQQQDLDKIIANAQKLNDMIGDGVLSPEQLEARIGEFMSGVMQEEMINGQTIDQYYGVEERRRADDAREESVEDLANTDEGFNFDDEYGTNEDGDPDELRFKAISKPTFNGVITAAQVQSVVARILSKFKLKPRVVVLQNSTMLPDDLRSRVAQKLGAGMGAQGLFDSSTGTVYMFSDMITGEADAEFVLFHEVYGHLGLRALFGEKFDAFLGNMYNAYPGVRKAVDLMVGSGTPKLEAIEEVLSDMAGQNQQTGPAKQFVGKIVAGLREIGLGRVADWMGKLTNAELSYHLTAARDAAQNGRYAALNGAPGEIRLSQTERIYEMFATKGEKATGYARFNPVTQSWIVFSSGGNPIDIRTNGYSVHNYDSYEEALSAMQRNGKVDRRKRSGRFVDEKLPGDLPNLLKVTDITGVKRWMRDQITRFQNEYRPVFDVVDYLKAQGRLTDQMDVKTALMLYERRTGAVVEDFRNKYVEPLMKLVEKARSEGADSGEVDTFLLARHAEERNKQIASINPKMPDKGSGMYTEDANKFLEEVAQKPYFNTLQEIGRLTDKMSDAKLSYQVQTGMITAKVAEKMSRTYKHYVNLSGQTGNKDKFDDPSRLAGGSKFNVKGKEARAYGRSEPASDILARTILGMEAALIRGQKNEVAQRLLTMLEANYDPNFVSINEVAYVRKEGEDGMVMEVEDENYIGRKDVMVAKVGGIPVTMRFKDTSRGSFADAIHGMVYPPESNAFMEKLGQFNRVIGQMLTTYNPAWAAVNFVRDAQTMYFNAASDGRITRAQAARMVKLLPKAIKVAYFMASNRSSNIKVDPALVTTFNEMKREGGLTTFLNRKDLEQQAKEIEDLLKEPSKWSRTKDGFGKFLKLAEFITTPMEIAPRLVAYQVAKEGGMSMQEAAKFSGEITVNFNMRGSNRAVRQLYLFFNPAVQGSAKLGSLFFELGTDYKLKFRGGKASQYAMGFVALGAIANLVGRAMGDDDEEDGINSLDKVPVYKRATSIVISPDTPGAAIPIPYGWNAFYALGHFGMDAILGVQPISTTAKRIIKSAFEAFTPMGTAGLDSSSLPGMVAKGVAPTATLPILEWVMNENRFGAPIYRDDSLFGGAKLPNSESAFRSVSPISQGVARGFNEISGGNKARAGLVDVNPAAIDFLISSYMPGMINELYKGASVGVRAARGEEIKSAPMPVIDRFTAKIPESYDAGAFRRAKELSETRWNEWKLYPDRRDQIREELPGLQRAHAVVASTTQEIRRLRANFAAIENNPTATPDEIVERKNALREREKMLYSRAVKAVMEAGPEFKDALIAND